MPTSGGPSQQAIPKAIRAKPATRYWYCDAGELLNQQQLPDKRRSGQERQSRRCGSITTRLLKEAILLAAELEGRDGRSKDELVGFLRRVANERHSCVCNVAWSRFVLAGRSSYRHVRRGDLQNSRGSAQGAGGPRHFNRSRQAYGPRCNPRPVLAHDRDKFPLFIDDPGPPSSSAAS